MSSIYDIIDPVNGAAPARATQRLEVARLTSGEKQGLKEMGVEIDGRDFIDLELDVPLPPPAADPQAQAAAVLKSVATPADDSQTVKDLRDKVKALEEQLLTIPPVCNRCGWPTGEARKVEPTADDLRDFLRAVMSGEPFIKSYHLFDNLVEVRFRTRTGEEDLAVKACLRKMLKANEIAQQSDLLSHARRFNFCCSLISYTSSQRSIEFKGMELPDQNESAYTENMEILVRQRIRQLPSQVLSMLLNVYDNFNELVDLLVAKAENPGFWKGIESSR